MRKFSLFVLLFVTITVFSIPLVSSAKDNENPNQERVCNTLKEPGVTKGLFGLCVAYCEAGANSGSVLDNYNYKKQPDDPEMPCLAEVVPTLSCACWSGYSAEQIGVSAGFEPASCEISGAFGSLFYANEAGVEFLGVGVGGCFHYNSITGDGDDRNTLSPGEEEVCRGEFQAFAEVDFDGFSCLD